MNAAIDPAARDASPIPKTAPPKSGRISVFTATAIVVANMIGVGVFTSLGFQVNAHTSSGFPILMLWVVGGVAALCGALSYGELAAALPRSGGEYHFLSQIYHPSIGFLAGWVSATVGFAAPTALLAMAFASYFGGIAPGVHPLALGIGIVWLVSLVHLRGLRQGSAFQNAWTYLNIALIVALIVAGFALGHRQPVSFAPVAGDWHLIAGTAFANNLVYVMYAYSGWNATTYIVNEIRDPSKNVPRSVFLGTLLVLALYVGLNAVFLYTTPVGKLAGELKVALIAGTHIFGDAGGRVVGALICVGLVASISSMMWIGPRVTVAMGEDLSALRIFSRKTKNGIPATAILLQLGVATLLLLTGKFERVLDFIQFSLTLCSFATVLGVIVLRFTQPALPRPYRTWGYPLTPLIFLAVAGYMLVFLVRKQPLESLAGLGTILVGLIVYFLSPKQPPLAADSSFSK